VSLGHLPISGNIFVVITGEEVAGTQNVRLRDPALGSVSSSLHPTGACDHFSGGYCVAVGSLPCLFHLHCDMGSDPMLGHTGSESRAGSHTVEPVVKLAPSSESVFTACVIWQWDTLFQVTSSWEV
jgi:hypothetical protein